jgi:hypothetical protein
MSDLISRQAAIDAMNEVYCHIEMVKKRPVNKTEQAVYLDMIGAVKSVPSAQPKIIHCNACKHWKQTTGKMRGFGLGECDFFGIKLVTCEGFCYWAERREYEQYSVR